MWPFIAEARDEVRAGKWPGPRLFIAGGVLMAPGGHYICQALQGDQRQWCEESVAIPIATPEQAREAVGRYAQGEVDVIMYDGLTNSRGLDKPVVAAMVDEAHARGLRVLVHNADARDVPGMVEAGIDGFVHPPARTRDEDGSLSSTAGQRQLPVAITLGGAERAIARGVATPAQRENYETVRHNVIALLEAGALPVFASDLPGLPAADVAPLATRALSGVGLSNAQVLQAATRNAAHGLLGRNDLGTLAPGKLADIILVDGNPIEDLGALSRVRLVIKDGVVVSDWRDKASAPASGS
ncbi:Amidohydrolase family protein [compost metagenome]